jgi:type II secretory pathway pseudopilin PulG
MTLVELLVVISILAALLALTAIAVSALVPSFKSTTGADQVAGVCASARQMARREGVPTGVRFTLDSDNICRTMNYIRQPDDVAAGIYLGRVEAAPFTTARIQTVNVDITPLVQDGDYLEIYGGGVVRRVTGNKVVTLESAGPDPNNKNNTVYVFQVSLNPVGPPLPPSPAPADLNTTTLPTAAAPTNYRIIRQPQVIDGETTIKLTQGVGIDFSTPQNWGYGVPLSTPPLAVGAGAGGPFDVLFSPSGQVIGQGTTSGMIFLWVRRAAQTTGKPDPDNSVDYLAGKPILVTVHVRSGAVAQYPVGHKGALYEFAQDGSGSGL